MLGVGLALTGVRGVGPVSPANRMLAREAQGLALSFVDDFFLASTGHYGSARVKDTGNPSNNYNSHPFGLLTYSGASPKLCRGPDGNLRYGAHNLYLNSEAPANQSISVIAGMTYQISVTGTVSITLSGAATGTVTSGNPISFTAATTTLTCGSTSGSGTVHLRRIPSDPTYLKATSSPAYELPYEWDENGDLLGIRVEEQRTNLALWSNDFTNAVWVKTNITAAKTAMGPDGVANSASTLTATAANATALQSITSTSAQRITSCYIKRRTGSGNIELTQDNGSTWTPVTVTSEWTRVNLPAVTSANPTVGIRIVMSGDAVDVAYFQHEVGALVTSPIETAGSTVTRAADNISLATSKFPFSAIEGTLVGKYFGDFDASEYVASLNPISPGAFLVAAGDRQVAWFVANIAAPGTENKSDFNRIGGAFDASGNVSVSLNGGTVATSTNSDWSGTSTSLYVGGRADSLRRANGHIAEIIYLPRKVDNAELRELTAP